MSQCNEIWQQKMFSRNIIDDNNFLNFLSLTDARSNEQHYILQKDQVEK